MMGGMVQRVFSYGTLRQREVQLVLFAREVPTVPDALPGWRLDWITVTDPEVIAASGSDRHPILRRGAPTDLVRGARLEIEDEELPAVDDYEVSDYHRIESALSSGVSAWVYVGDDEVGAFLASIADERTAEDSRALVELMRRISGHEPRMWNDHTIGFGSYHYRYASGREGDAFVIGFYPRKAKTTVYLMDGAARYADLLAGLGAHTITGYCLHLKRLSDLDLAVLERILRRSYEHIASLGVVDRILWQAADE